MGRYLARRVMQAGAIVLLVATLSFVLLRIAPGDPYSVMADNPNVPPSVVRAMRAEQGLDRPLPEQYLRYLGNVARGHLGYSYSQHRPVADALADALPNTLLLMLTALSASFLVGIALGIAQARRQGSLADRLLGLISLAFYSMPDFWLGLMILLLFALRIPILPAGGVVSDMHDYLGVGARVGDRLIHLVLPVLTMTLFTAAGIARYQRSALLEAGSSDFVRTARAKGVHEARIARHHILRNALLPVITLLGLALPALLGGAVFIEKIFSWPGMGLLAARGIEARDYPLVVAAAVLGASLVAVGSLIADLLHAAADPRVRLE
ncbi:MAG: ABC transporter permease [Gemmatimonadota bacterium]|nr:ABC transporter permease [Gemmatimonadota bacterium]